MRETARCLDCGDAFQRDAEAHWRVRCLPCWREAKGLRSTPAVTQVAPVIEDAMLKRLIQLTHPDKHGGSEAAVIATRFLLELRARSRTRQ